MISRVFGTVVLVAGVSLVPVLPVAPASAAGVTVVVDNVAFSPKTVTVPIGGSVTWRFRDSVAHNSVSQGFWSSRTMRSGTFTHEFGSAGSYGYLCTVHPSMRGTVRVPVRVTGTPAGGWTLRWSTAAGSGNTSFDVQVRNPGSKAWQPFKTDTTGPSARYNPARDGTYAVRARTSKGSRSSGWSPARTFKIT